MIERSAPVGLAALLLASCAVGPDFHRPAPPATGALAAEPLPSETAAADVPGGAVQRFVAGRDIPAQWWTLFGSESLNALITQALAANADLGAAQAALRVAQENIAAQRGAFYPSIDANFSPSRQKNPTGSVAPTAASGTPIFSLYTAQVTVSYVPDVFGGTRRQLETLVAQGDAQRFQLEATYLTLTANIVAAAVQEASLRAQIAATQEIVGVETELLALLRRQSALGQIAQADVVAQEAALAQTQQGLYPLQKQLGQERDLLAALVGRFPADAPSEQFDLATLQLPQELPLSLPARLVEQRPDVRAAEANLHAASAQIGVAVANRLPNITLSASDGTTATSLGGLFTPGTGFWSLAASLTQPVFAGGTLLHRQRAAEAAYDQAAAQYRGAVITAFQNVADTLRALAIDADALQAAVRAENAAADSLQIARRRVELGQTSYLSLLNAQQTYQQARINLVQAQAGRFADTAALFQALGGGWWNRTAAATPPDAARLQTP